MVSEKRLQSGDSFFFWIIHLTIVLRLLRFVTSCTDLFRLLAVELDTIEEFEADGVEFEADGVEFEADGVEFEADGVVDGWGTSIPRASTVDILRVEDVVALSMFFCWCFANMAMIGEPL